MLPCMAVLRLLNCSEECDCCGSRASRPLTLSPEHPMDTFMVRLSQVPCLRKQDDVISPPPSPRCSEGSLAFKLARSGD